jgi:hypothetical protein
MLVVSATTVSATGNPLAQMQAFKVLFGRIMDKRVGEYFNAFGVMPDDANDPQGKQDRKERTIVSAQMDGFSFTTANLTVKYMVPTMSNGVPTFTTNPAYGIVQSYRASISRAAHGLPKNLSDRKSGRKRRRPVKKSSRWQRLYAAL